MNRISWTGRDKDRFFGPFTISNDATYPQWGAVVTSADDEDRPANARFHLHKLTVLFPLPGWLIKPHRERVEFRHLSDAARERLGRDWYWQIDERAFGFTAAEGVLHLKWGRQSDDSTTERSRCIFLPWKQWRHVRHSFYDMDGDLFAHVPDRDWDAREKLKTACPTMKFCFADFDGEEITATTRIEEREWRFGEGKFNWLSLFRRPLIKRSLELRFSSEVGRRKGSWKGGTIGHSIEMRSGELHEAAFRRYCQEQHLKFIGPDIDSERGQDND